VEYLVKLAGTLQDRCLQVSRSLSEKLSSATASDPKRESYYESTKGLLSKRSFLDINKTCAILVGII